MAATVNEACVECWVAKVSKLRHELIVDLERRLIEMTAERDRLQAERGGRDAAAGE